MARKQAVPTVPEQRRPLLDFAGAAKYTGLSEKYLRRMTAERRIPHLKMTAGRTGRVFFNPDQLDAWLETLDVAMVEKLEVAVES